jgi:undecaprenyl-diphosphatase
LDIQLFFLINRKGENILFDLLMPVVSNIRYFYILIGLGWLFLMLKKNTQNRMVGLAIIALIACSDQLCTLVLKPAFARVRPYDAMAEVRVYQGPDTPWRITNTAEEKGALNTKSMPSAHAVNIFAAAVFLSFYFRKLWPLFFGIAALIGYSRVYLGDHYPLDVAAGAAIGALLAIGFIWITNQFLRKIMFVAAEENSSEGNPK